jgi:hypothetical protein
MNHAGNTRYSTFLLAAPPGSPIDEPALPLKEPSLCAPSLLATPTPIFFQHRDTFPHTFGHSPITVHEFPEGRGPLEYTASEWGFLTTLLGYFEGVEEFQDGVFVPDEFRRGQYLEGLGEEQWVSLRLPVLEQLLV